MTDPRAIGIFDSGVGGLTVLRAVQQRLPRESTIYLGDLARCPYGPRPQAEVRGFALQIADLLAEQDIKLLIVACNTATAAAFDALTGRYPFPVIGVVEPGARAAAAVSTRGKIGVIATLGTVQSGAYRAAIARARPEADVVEHAASWLVPMIERGVVTHREVANRLSTPLAEFAARGVDTLILGCTHFPLVADIFASAAAPGTSIVESATTTAAEVAAALARADALAAGDAYHRLLVTGPAEAFAQRARAMFRTSPPIETIDLVRGAA